MTATGSGLGVGIQLPVQARSTAFAQPWEHDAGPAELIEVATAADEAGLLYIGVCDHVAIPRRLVGEMGPVWYDAFTTLGLLAGVTRRVRLLTHVLVPAYRHPLQVASAAATVDHLSGGRLVLGVGAGHVDEELEAFGVEARGEALDEAIVAVSAALAEEWPVVEGPTWAFADLTVGPRPVRQPRPPVWIGGSSARALRRVAELGDGWLPQGTPLKDLPAAYDRVREMAVAAGRDGDRLSLGANGPWIHVGDPPPGADAGDRRLVHGPAERVAAALRRWGDAGADHVQVAFPLARSAGEYADQLRAFGSDVLPLLDDGGD